MEPVKNAFVTTINGCARCGLTHADLLLEPLNNPPDDGSTTHWAPCPTNGQPILGRAFYTDEEVKQDDQDEQEA